MEEELIEKLQRAAAGLLYPSDSDEPFEPFAWKATNADSLKQIGAQGKPTAPVKETSLADFFAELLASEEGEKYKRLRQILESELSGIRVLRIGEIEVAVYLIGKTRASNWAGLRTISVET